MTTKISTSTQFVEEVANLRFENAFNPYAHICPDHDTPNAATIRRHNLNSVLEAAIKKGIDSIWIARDLGYRGGRRTGLALTDEMHLSSHASLLGTPPLSRATRGPAVAERTATVVWQMLRNIDRPIFLWNIFPLHPHSPTDPMTNRCHTRAERIACKPLLSWLLDTLQPKNVITIGRDAQYALAELDIPARTVRHPSYGGQSDFIQQLNLIYDISDKPNNAIQKTLFGS